MNIVRKSRLNIIISIISQAMVIICGLFLPNIIINNLGSEMNGYISTSTNIFGYVSLVEAGLGAACLNSLYKPIADGDKKTVASIMKSSSKQYNIVALLYFVVGTIISAIFPFCVKSSCDYITLFLIIFIEALGGAAFILTTSYIKQLLIADGKHFVELIIHSLAYVAGSIVKIILIITTKQPIAMQAGFFAVQLLECLSFYIYYRKRYSDINCYKDTGKVVFKERKYFMVHQVSSAIFSCTDLILVSTVCSLNEASVYSVYGIVFLSIIKVLNTMFSSLSFILGDAYFKKDDYVQKRDIFFLVFNAFAFALLTTALILCNPFVELYTRGSDINYVDKYLPFLFFTAQTMNIVRVVSNNTIRIAGHAKQNIWATITESSINIVVSIPACIFLGVYGVIIGTIAALLFRTVQMIVYENKIILKRKGFKDFIVIIMMLIISSLLYFIFHLANFKFDNFWIFIVIAALICLIVIIVYSAFVIVISKKVRLLLPKIFKKAKVNS